MFIKIYVIAGPRKKNIPFWLINYQGNFRVNDSWIGRHLFGFSMPKDCKLSVIILIFLMKTEQRGLSKAYMERFPRGFNSNDLDVISIFDYVI